MNQNSANKQAVWCALGAVGFWSTVASAFKISLNYLKPIELVFFATLVSWLFFMLVLAWQKRLAGFIQDFRRHYRLSLVLGEMNPVLYYTVLLNAYARLPAQEAQIINYTWAMTLALLSAPILGQKLRRTDWAASLLCYGGVWVMVTHGDVLHVRFSSGPGVVLALGSTLIWALYWLLNARDTREPVMALAQNFTCALPLAALAMGATSAQFAVSKQALMGAAYIGLFEMGLTFLLWLHAIKRTSHAARIANLIFLSPVVSLFLIHWLLREPIYLSSIAGFCMIVGGLWVQQHALSKHV